MTQQARQFRWKLQDQGWVMRFLVHDRDTKFPIGFNAVFASEPIEVILTRLACAECQGVCGAVGVRSVREECLDHLLLINERLCWLPASSVRNTGE